VRLERDRVADRGRAQRRQQPHLRRRRPRRRPQRGRAGVERRAESPRSISASTVSPAASLCSRSSGPSTPDRAASRLPLERITRETHLRSPRASCHGSVAAVDRDLRAGDEGRIVAGQERRQLRDLVRVAVSADRDLGQDAGQRPVRVVDLGNATGPFWRQDFLPNGPGAERF
jgi:hypothetical protein